jgi:hypothetical protein
MQEVHAAISDSERQAGDFFGLADALLRVTMLELGIKFRLSGEAGLEHGGFDGGGFDGVDAHAWAKVDGKGAGHAGEGGFAGGVGDEVFLGEAGVDAADVNDAALGCFKFGQQRLGEQEGGKQVDV